MMATMNDLRRLNANKGRRFLILSVLLLALIRFIPTADAGPNVVAWGAGMIYNPADTNDYGQSIVPTDLTNAVMVAGGWWHSLALKADGTLEGWGDDSQGQTSFYPAGASNYVAIACGWWHSLALKSDGTVAAAGYSLGDLYGQTDVPNNLEQRSGHRVRIFPLSGLEIRRHGGRLGGNRFCELRSDERSHRIKQRGCDCRWRLAQPGLEVRRHLDGLGTG